MINKTTGTSSSGTCCFGNHAQSWTGTVPNDIRFTNNVTIAANSPLTGAVSGLSGGNKLTSAGDFSSGVANLTALGMKYTGNDILFTSNDGTTKIKYEREQYSSGTLVDWVSVATLSHTTDTVVCMYYGNSGASDQQQATSVWDANMKACITWTKPSALRIVLPAAEPSTKSAFPAVSLPQTGSRPSTTNRVRRPLLIVLRLKKSL